MYAEAQTFFCFAGFDSGVCSGGIIAGPVNRPEDCCYITDRGGVNAGAYVQTGNETCINCMTVIGEKYCSRRHYRCTLNSQINVNTIQLV